MVRGMVSDPLLASSSQASSPPERIGEYLIKTLEGGEKKKLFRWVNPLGEGGFSQVWMMHDLENDELKAVKIFAANGPTRKLVRNLQYFLAYQDPMLRQSTRQPFGYSCSTSGF